MLTVIGPSRDAFFCIFHSTNFLILHSESLNTLVNIALSAFSKLLDIQNQNLLVIKIDSGRSENGLKHGMQIWRRCLHRDGAIVLYPH